MKIITGCKLVPEEQDIQIKADGSLELDKAAIKISQFDLNAIESASQIKALTGEAEIIALSVGGSALGNTKARKDILSRGPDKLVLVSDESLTHILPHQTAKIMAKAAEKTGFDLIVCGDGSGDLYAQQTPMRLAAELGVPAVSGVSRIVAAGAGMVTVERNLETVVEVLEVTLPAVISVSADINEPAIPGMKAILGAAKKPVEALTLAELAAEEGQALAEMPEVKAPDRKARKNVIVEGDGDEQIAEFISHLRKVIN